MSFGRRWKADTPDHPDRQGGERWEALIEEAADLMWTEIDGPLGRASMEGLENRPLFIARAEVAFGVFRSLLSDAEKRANRFDDEAERLGLLAEERRLDLEAVEASLSSTRAELEEAKREAAAQDVVARAEGAEIIALRAELERVTGERDEARAALQAEDVERIRQHSYPSPTTRAESLAAELEAVREIANRAIDALDPGQHNDPLRRELRSALSSSHSEDTE
jgi:hypothetical protein